MLAGTPAGPCLVFRYANGAMQHVGVFIGGGWVIEARGTAEGVIRSHFNSYPWTHYACPNLPKNVDIASLEPPYTARVQTRTGNGISLWKDNKKTARVIVVPEGCYVVVHGKPDALGFADALFNGKRGVADTQYLLPVEGVTYAHAAEAASAALVASEGIMTGEQDAWGRVIHAYTGLSEAVNQMGDLMQDFNE